MRCLRFLIGLGLVGALGACGGGSRIPSGPDPVPSASPTPAPAGGPPTFLDGATGATAVAQIVPAAPRSGEAVSVTGAGYLTRQQLFTGAPIQLWHATEDYVHDFAYTEFSDHSFRTIRWSRAFVVTLDGDLATNDAVVAKTREVLAEVQRTTGLAATIGPGGACTISLDSTLPDREDAVGQTTLSYRGADIVKAEMVFVNRAEITGAPGSSYRNTLLHEMGHALGLGHSPDTHDVMTPGSGPGTRVADYQDGESTALRMIYVHRAAGNYFPDRDPAVSARSDAYPLRRVFKD